MSESLSPQNLPPLLNHNRTTDLLTLLRDPMTIAVFASIAVHSFLAAALPLIPSAKPAEDLRQVRVIELSPLERLRLPQPGALSSTNPFQFPQSRATSPYVLPPIGNSSPSPGPSIGSGSNANPNSSTSYLSNEEFFEELNRRIAEAEKQREAEEAKKRQEIELANQREAEAAKKREAEKQNSSTPSDEPTPPDNQTPSGQPSGQNPSSNSPDQPKNSPSGGQQQSPGSGETSAGDLRAQQSEPPTQQVTQVAQGDAPEAWNDWLKRNNLNSALGGGGAEPESLTIPCPIATCDAKESAISIAITPDGKMLEEILQVITGDKALDEAARKKALETVESELKATGKYQIRQFRIQFQEQAGN
jgi:outer membrane biosynthesis protein TonB